MSKTRITDDNCVQASKELWSWLVDEYGDSEELYEVEELKKKWPGWKKYYVGDFYCPLCIVYLSPDCVGCPLKYCYGHGYSDYMSNINIVSFNDVIQELED